MTRGKLGLIGLSMAVLCFAGNLPVWAQAQAETSAEEREYAAREAAAPDLEDFVGGGCWSPGPVEIALLILISPILLPIGLITELCKCR